MNSSHIDSLQISLRSGQGQPDKASKCSERVRDIVVRLEHSPQDLKKARQMIQDSDLLSKLEPMYVIDFCTLLFPGTDEMTPQKKDMIFHWLDVGITTPHALAGAYKLLWVGKQLKINDVIDLTHQWAQDRWNGTPKLEEYYNEMAIKALDLAMTDQQYEYVLDPLLEYLPPNSKLDAMGQELSWLSIWGGVMVKDRSEPLNNSLRVLERLVAWGEDLNPEERSPGTPSLAESLGAYFRISTFNPKAERAMTELLNAGMKFEHLEERLQEHVWAFIQDHPRARRELLNAVVVKQTASQPGRPQKPKI